MSSDVVQVDEKTLDTLLKKSQTSDFSTFTFFDIQPLIPAFTYPLSSIIRSKAYVLLSAICQKAHAKGKNSRNEGLVDLFGPLVADSLAETNDFSLRIGICTLYALFQVDWEIAVAVISRDGVMENIIEGIDLSRSSELFEDVAHLLGQASSHKNSRQLISTQAVQWLEAKSQQSSNPTLRAAAAVALIKHLRGVAADASEVTTSETSSSVDQENSLVDMMKGLVLSKVQASLPDAIEGLAYLSTRPEIKETLSSDTKFLRQLFSIIPQKKPSASPSEQATESALAYGALVIVSNLCAYRPRLSEEQAQMEKLKRMAQAAKQSVNSSDASALESNEQVSVRVRRVIDAGGLSVIGAVLSVSDSLAVRLQLGKTISSLVEDKENRGKVLQSGGAKVLSMLTKHALATLTSKEKILDSAFLEIIQALAKLAITSSPLQVFGPNVGAMYDAIRPFSILLQHPSSTLLQKFEANMALTNLSSYQPDVAERIASSDGLLSKADLLMLEDHVLVRRSAVELICNLIAGSDDAFAHYGGAPDSPNAQSKLQILVALADVDDLATVLAASGALATLTCSPYACVALAKLQKEGGRVIPILTQLIDPSVVVFPNEENIEDDRTTHEDSGLVHRGVVCVSNIWKGIDDDETQALLGKDAQSVGLVKALARLVKGEGITKEQMVLMSAAEALQIIAKGRV